MVKNYLREHSLRQNLNSLKFVLSNQFGMYKNNRLIYEPRYIVAFITYRCNLKCDFCSVYGMEQNVDVKYSDMTFRFYREILKKYDKAVIVELTGGEPFLHKNVIKMIKYGQICKKNVAVNTNGILIGDMIEQIIDSDPSLLNISLNACDKKDYKIMNDKNLQLFDSVLKNIEGLVHERNKKNKKIKLRISYICTKKNYQKIPDMLTLAKELGVDRVQLYNLAPIAKAGYTRDHCLYKDDKDVAEVLKNLDNSQIDLEVTGPNLYDREYVNKRIHCFQPFTRITIRPDGDVFTCCMCINKAGKINQGQDIWNNTEFMKNRRTMIRNVPSIIPPLCKTCSGYVG